MTNLLDLKGVIPPMITPLSADGVVDGAAVERLVNHMLVNNCAGIFALGSSGEGPWLTTDQRKQLITYTVRAASGRAPVLVGALEPSTGRTLEALRMIEDLGADAVVITSPYYFAADASTQLRHFEQVAAASILPVVLYNIPQMTHNPIAIETVRETAQFDNLIGLKDSAANMEVFERFLALRETHASFRVFQGAEKLSLQSLLAGADGLVPGLGNLAPQWFVQIYNAVCAGREADAYALQTKVDQLWTLHGYDYWLVCLKYAASLLGFGSGNTCGHLARLDESGRTAIRELVADATQT